MLTPDERDVAVERMKVYPKGTPTCAWGWGPMAEDTADPEDEDEPSYDSPWRFKESVQREYG